MSINMHKRFDPLQGVLSQLVGGGLLRMSSRQNSASVE